MFKSLKKYLKKIQHSDEATKKRWLIVSSAIAMILVISLWLVYISWTIKSVGDNIEKQGSEPGFWQIFKTGLKVVGESAWNNIKNIVSKITGERTITIE
ncbi:MAG: hypothetical protein DDT18_00966 [Actinobacteria bacterium]|nr:hypothetical protein [Actinomycetota bacterium]